MLALHIALLVLTEARGLAIPLRRDARPMAAATARPLADDDLWVRVHDSWFNLSGFDHPGGPTLLRRHAGQDVTHLFYSNHFRPSLEPIRRFEAPAPPSALAALPPRDRSTDPCSPLYSQLKREVHAALVAHGIEWRHRFRSAPLVARFGLLALGATLRRHRAGGGAAERVAVAALYGLAMGRATWTHAHNAVHNPDAASPWMRRLMRADLANVADAWLAEHQAHHAETNRAADPDTRWFAPIFAYRALAGLDPGAAAPSSAAVRSVFCYALLVPFMATKAAAHALSSPGGRRVVATSLAVAPARFALDVWLLGARAFGVALLSATAYLVGTFVATHAASADNYDVASGCWMTDQLRATNNVAPTSALFSSLCGGINNHIEHHLFPHVSGDVLHAIAPVVRDFATRHGLPYNAYARPDQLWSMHARFLRGCPVRGVASSRSRSSF